MKGKIIFTNADHDKVEDRIFPALKVPGAKEIHVSDKQVNEYMRFGVAITQSSCYELSRIGPERRHELLKSLYSKEGLGLSIGRICIGSSDYSPEIYTYDDVDGDVELKHFSIERDLEYVDTTNRFGYLLVSSMLLCAPKSTYASSINTSLSGFPSSISSISSRVNAIPVGAFGLAITTFALFVL